MAAANYTLRVENRTAVNFLYLALLFVLLSFSYLTYVAPYYGYMGFYTDVRLIKVVEAVILLVTSFYLVHRQRTVFSGRFISLIYLFVAPSSLVLYMLTDESRLFIYSIVGGLLLTSYSSNVARVFLDNRRSKILEFLEPSIIGRFSRSLDWGSILYLLFGSVTLIVFGSLYYHNGLPSLIAVSLSQVYEVRDAVTYGFLVAYLFNWQANVINPFLIALGIRKNSPSAFLAGVSLQLLLYLYTGHRAALFTIPFIIVVYLFMANRSLVGGLLKTFNVVIVGSLVLFWTFAEHLIPSIVIRRVFFLPPLIRSTYFEFFSSNPLMRLGGTSLGFLWSNPYSKSLPVIIGDRYFDSAYANVGYLASGFADFGIVGVLVFAVLAGLAFALIDHVSHGLAPGLVAGIWIMPIFNFDSSRFTTLILTHGLFFAFVVSFIVRRTSLGAEGR